MTDKSLSERLRQFTVVFYNPDGSQGLYYPPHCTEAADALDQQAAEIAALQDRTERMLCESCGTLTRTADCDCTRYGHNTGTQRLVNYADYLQETARQQADALDAKDREIERLRDTLRNADAKMREDLDRATRNRGARVAT